VRSVQTRFEVGPKKTNGGHRTIRRRAHGWECVLFTLGDLENAFVLIALFTAAFCRRFGLDRRLRQSFHRPRPDCDTANSGRKCHSLIVGASFSFSDLQARVHATSSSHSEAHASRPRHPFAHQLQHFWPFAFLPFLVFVAIVIPALPTLSISLTSRRPRHRLHRHRRPARSPCSLTSAALPLGELSGNSIHPARR